MTDREQVMNESAVCGGAGVARLVRGDYQALIEEGWTPEERSSSRSLGSTPLCGGRA